MADHNRTLTSTETAARRRDLIHAVHDFEQASVQLRHQLRTLETLLRRTRRHYERGGTVGELQRLGDIPSARAHTTAALAQFERARRVGRIATARLGSAEGTSLGAVARLLGISRQRLSLLTQHDNG